MARTSSKTRKTKPAGRASSAKLAVFTDADIQEYVRMAAERVTLEDLAHVVAKARQISRAFHARGPLAALKLDAEHMLKLCSDYLNGRYQAVPFWSLSPMVVALNYVTKPVDIIPDFIPGMGHQDDLMILKECLRVSGGALKEYRAWLGAKAPRR